MSVRTFHLLIIGICLVEGTRCSESWSKFSSYRPHIAKPAIKSADHKQLPYTFTKDSIEIYNLIPKVFWFVDLY